MMYAAVCIAALMAAALTFVSGFGLGTLLLPAFALFVPAELAVAATAVVHLANNVLKLVMTGGRADRRVVLRFGLPALGASIVGALAQRELEGLHPVAVYTLIGHACEITWVKGAVGAVIVGFAVLELSPRYEGMAFDARYLPVGGVLSGFFGGLSGHQGALRAGFLARCGLTKEAFVASGVVCSVMVDVSRLSVYGAGTVGRLRSAHDLVGPIVAGCVAAFVGTLIGSRVVSKMTLRGVRRVVGVALLLFGVAMAAGAV
ncbi:MAG: TSUP family transporter [Phycisphaerales bacterium]